MFYVAHITALEILRDQRTLLPELLAHPRTRSLKDPSLLAPNLLDELMQCNGAISKPFHVMTDDPNNPWRNRDDVVVHAYSCQLPYRSVIFVSSELSIASPELIFTQLAASGEYDELDLACIGYEMCGTYVTDQSWDGLTNTGISMTTVAKINRFAAHLKNYRGVERARKVLRLIHDNSNSPMESIMALIFAGARRIGGLHLGRIALNHPVETNDGTKYIDLYFLDYQLGLEYKGRKAHSVEATQRDDRRQNRIAGAGITTINVWYEDLVEDHLFNKLVQDIVNTMGKRLRIRSKQFASDQQLLRAKLLPTIKTYGSLTIQEPKSQ